LKSQVRRPACRQQSGRAKEKVGKSEGQKVGISASRLRSMTSALDDLKSEGLKVRRSKVGKMKNFNNFDKTQQLIAVI